MVFGLLFLSTIVQAQSSAIPPEGGTPQLATRHSPLATTYTCSFTRDWSAALAAFPAPTFAGELRRLARLFPASPRPVPPEPEARPGLLEAELRGLREALAPLPTTQTQALIEQYRALRESNLQPPASSLQPFPQEFSLYLEGVLAARDGDTTRALRRWSALLALPEPERRQRSVWAAYMIGRASVRTDPAGAIIYLEECRRLAASGFADPLGLAPASMAWQVRAEIEDGHFARALGHSLPSSTSSTGSTGSTTSTADFELIEEICARAAAAEDPAALDEFALSAAARPIMTAFLFTQSAGDPSAVREAGQYWLKAVTQLGGAPAPAEAEDLAALAGNVGAPEAISELKLALPTERSFPALLAAVLREGPTDQLLAEVDRACRERPQTSTTSTTSMAEDLSALLSAMQLARGEFLPALQTALDAGRWNDVAYLAERVFTSAELSSFLGSRTASSAMPTHNPPSAILDRLHHLLARRLARAGDLESSRAHFAQGTPDLLSQFDKLIRDRRISDAPAINDNLRASALLEAGLITRRLGLALYGTELAPDWALYGGRSGGPDPVRLRSQTTSTLAASAAERTRLNAECGMRNAEYGITGSADVSSALDISSSLQPPASSLKNSQLTTHNSQPPSPIPHSAFRIPHFRSLAAGLLWDAAGLLPDNDPRLAAALWHGGRSLAISNPAAADKFYKALARRCAGLPIGRDAARRHWFPATPPPDVPPLTLPSTIHVAPHGDDANDGASWSVSKRTIGAALAAARVLDAPIWAAAGVYRETLDLDEDDDGLALYGGFRGGETSPAQRRPGTDALTILDAGGTGRAVTLDGLSSATLDGLLVRGGEARGPGAAGNGGGIFCRGTGPGIVLRNCVVTQNSAASHGGGIALQAASPTITSCSLAGNRADAGGGGLAALAGARPRLEGCVFADNGSRFGRGGALYVSETRLALTSCRFAGNWAEAGATAYADRDASYTLVSSIVAQASSLQREGRQDACATSCWTSIPYCNPQTGLTALVDRRADFTTLTGRAVFIQPDAARPTVALVMGVRGTMLEILGDFTRATAQGRPYRILDVCCPAFQAESGKHPMPPSSSAGPLPSAPSGAVVEIPFTYQAQLPLRQVRLYFRKSRQDACATPWQAGDVATSTGQTLRFNAVRLGPGLYDFYTLATDAAGNTESPPPRPDLSATISQ